MGSSWTGVELVSPALAEGFLTTRPQGKSPIVLTFFLMWNTHKEVTAPPSHQFHILFIDYQIWSARNIEGAQEIYVAIERTWQGKKNMPK